MMATFSENSQKSARKDHSQHQIIKLLSQSSQIRDANSKETVAGQKTNTSKRKSALIKKPPPPLFTCHQNWEVWNESGKRGSVDPQELERRCWKSLDDAARLWPSIWYPFKVITGSVKRYIHLISIYVKGLWVPKSLRQSPPVTTGSPGDSKTWLSRQNLQPGVKLPKTGSHCQWEKPSIVGNDIVKTWVHALLFDPFFDFDTLR